jgi:hypothetical protein
MLYYAADETVLLLPLEISADIMQEKCAWLLGACV